ncbi:MAG: PQQ-dependent sugar dehydrogenase [Luteolibacter sp.]
MDQIAIISFISVLALASVEARIGVEKVADKFSRPLWVGQPLGIDDRLWVVEQDGRIWAVDAKTGARGEKPFLDIVADVNRKNNELGLLGLAFAPDFKKSGRFYVNFTDKDMFSRIVRFTANTKNLAETDPASAEVLFTYKQPHENHNGGWIGFGPDGMLYIGTGDGGSQNDPHENGQSINTFLAKILRVDVSPAKGYTVPKDNPFVAKADAVPEVWAYGVRNPWRCSFDRKNGDFWIGDVGQNNWEEVDHVTKGQFKGANFGWRLREGDVPNPDAKVAGNNPQGATDPVHVYKHGAGKGEGFSVTGGYVYHGPIKELDGRYIFGDYQNPRIWSFGLIGSKVTDFKDHTDELQPQGGRINLISSFGEGNDGSIYIVDHTGVIYRIVGR